MKVLFLSQLLPYPLDAGAKIRAYYTLRHLAQNHEVTLVSFVRGSDTPEAVAHLEGLCQQVVTIPMPRSRPRDVLAIAQSLQLGRPWLIVRDHAPAMHAAMQTLCAESRFNLIHADQLWMAPYAQAAAEASGLSGGRPRLVLDQHNAVHLIPGRMAQAERRFLVRSLLQHEARLLAAYEAQMCQMFDEVVTVTEADRLALDSLGPKPLPGLRAVIPICVDPGPRPARAKTHQPNLMFLGGMHWPPNADGAAWFAQHILPAVRAQVPASVFWAVGKNPPASLYNRSDDAAVRTTGFVADVDAYWHQSRVFVAPLRSGGGMRVKIIEAWARGVPVVSTTVGAEGLASRDGENVLLADSADAFAQAVVRVLSVAGLAERLAAAGRDTVERHYDWRKVYPAWDRVYALAGRAVEAVRG